MLYLEEIIKIKYKYLRGQIRNWEPNGIGYLWKMFKPTYIGLFKNKRLNGHGLRITYSDGKTMGLHIGYWLNGRIYGPGISITENSILIGNFTKIEEVDVLEFPEPIQIFKTIDNKNYLDQINMTKPAFNDD